MLQRSSMMSFQRLQVREISQVIYIRRRAKMNAKREQTAIMKSRKKTGGGPDTMEISKESNLFFGRNRRSNRTT